MANLYATFFKKLAQDDQGNTIAAGELPGAGGGGKFAFTANTRIDVPKNARFVRLLADADAYLASSDNSPTATATSGLKLEADVAEYFGLDPQKVRSGNFQLAVYDGSS